MNKTIIVKIGTESLADFRNNQKVEKMVHDIIHLIQEKIRVVLVSSGAVEFGKQILPSSVTNKQVQASVGQPILMGCYREKFGKHGIQTAQVLPTHATLEDITSHRAQFITTIHDILAAGILPIINENDPLSTAEMRELKRGADNDQNALLVTQYLKASEIVLITNPNGVYEHRGDANSRISVLHRRTITDGWISCICGEEKSETGTGGMQSKLRIGRAFAENNGITHICDGLTSGLYEHIVGKTTKGGTSIIP